jgi:hypothetical protein
VFSLSGAQSGEKYELSTGQSRTEPHRDRPDEDLLQGTTIIPELAARWLTPQSESGLDWSTVCERAWRDGNGQSHLQATMLGQSLRVPVAEGKSALGIWQQILNLECDVRTSTANRCSHCYGRLKMPSGLE